MKVIIYSKDNCTNCLKVKNKLSKYNPTILLLGGVSTLTMFSGLTLYAVQTTYDYTQHTSILISSLLGLICFGFFMTFFHIPYLSIIYSSLGAVLFSFVSFCLY